jgi:hypothetical protein
VSVVASGNTVCDSPAVAYADCGTDQGGGELGDGIGTRIEGVPEERGGDKECRSRGKPSHQRGVGAVAAGDASDIRQINENMKAMLASVQAFRELASELRGGSQSLIEFKGELNNLKTSMSELAQMVKDDGRGGGLATRMTKIEGRLETIADNSLDRFDAIAAWQKEHDRTCRSARQVESSNRWKFAATLAAAIAGLIGTIIASYVAIKAGK